MMATNYVYFMPRYFGNVMKRNINGNDTIVEGNALLQYDELSNSYYWYSKGKDAIIKFGKNFADMIEDKENERKVETYFLTTDIPSIDGQLYIDKNSLVEVKNGKKSR